MPLNYSDLLISGERVRPFIIGAASLGVILITVYCLTEGITIVFPHLYYIPVVLAAYWYRRLGVVFSAVLGGIYLIIVAALAAQAAPAEVTEAAIRVIVFIIIAAVVAYLRERLAQEEEEYQTIFESTGTAMALVEEDMTISRANYKMEEMSGYSPDETLGKQKWADFVAEDDLERMVEYHRLRRTDPASAPPHYESRIIDSKGCMRDISLTISIIPGTKKSVASLVDITERKAAEAVARQKLEFEETLAAVTSRFTGIFDFDNAVNGTLADIGRLSRADRAYLFLLREGGRVLDNTHEWCAKGVNPQIDNLQNQPSELTPWWMKKVRNREIIHIADVSNLPPEAEAEREMLEMQEIRSLIVLPVFCREKPAGFMGFDNVRETGEWTDEDILILRTIAEIVGRTLELRRMQGVLKESEEKFHDFFRTSQDAVFITSKEGELLDLNESLVELFGYDNREEIQKMHVADVYVHPEERQKHIRIIAKQGYTKEYPADLRKKDGTIINTLITSVARKDKNGNVIGFQGTIRDITERKRAEAKASHLNSVLLAVRDLDQLITHEKDPVRLIAQACEVLAWTRGYHNVWVALFNDSGHVTGAAESGLGEELFRQIRERLDTGDLPECVRSALAGKWGIVVTEEPAGCPEGCPLSATCSLERRGVITARLESGGRVYGVISLAVPLSLIHDREEQALFMEAASDLAFALRASDMETERKAAERALQESEEKFRALAENSPDSIMRFDRHCRHLYANPVIEQQSGIPAEEFIGKTHAELGFPKDLVELWEGAIQNVFATGKENRIEFELPDGIWIDWLLVPEFSPDGEVKVVVTAGRDITDRKAAEQALEVANKKLQLLSGITRHDILNQVTGLAGYTDLLSEVLPDDPDMRKYIDRITKATSAIERQITFTRDYEHLGVDPSGWQRVADTAERAASGCADRSVNVSISTGTLEIFADPMLEKVFYNLFDNAIRHGEHVTEISVTCQEKDEDGSVVIAVEDDGIGIPAEIKEKIFRHGFGKHTGYGLFLVQEILAISGMSIQETGEEETGARFEITVPAGGWRLMP